MRPLVRAAGPLLLACASVVVALATIEAGLAVAAWRRPCGGRAPFWQPDRTLGWKHSPGVRGEAVVCDVGDVVVARTEVTINAAGDRDVPRTVARTPGRPRVALLGDSFTEAMQVQLPETFAARLEQSLSAEMLNFGVSGYSTDNELRLYLHRVRRYRPDLVVLVLFVGNDVAENGARSYFANPGGLPPKPWLTVRAGSVADRRCLAAHRTAARLAAAVPEWLWRRSRMVRSSLSQAVPATLRTLCPGVAEPQSDVRRLLGVYGPPPNRQWAEAWDATERNVDKLRRRVLRDGAGFALVIAPASFEFVPPMRWFADAPDAQGVDFDYPTRRLDALCARDGMPCLFLKPALAAAYASTGDAASFSWDGHWTRRGHRTVAAAMEPFLRALVQASPPAASR